MKKETHWRNKYLMNVPITNTFFNNFNFKKPVHKFIRSNISRNQNYYVYILKKLTFMTVIVL